MSRVLLIGRGPWPDAHAEQVGFSQLRMATFRDSLEASGHAVRVALLTGRTTRDAPDGWVGMAEVQEEGPGWIECIQALSEGAEILVGAGPYNPSRAAVLVAGDRPVWADLPGDPFAELQAVDLAEDKPLARERRAAAHAAALPALLRADAISTVSDPQRHAALGQLGVLGRLVDDAPPVHTIPIAYDFPLPRAAPRVRQADDALVVALSGAFNPWFDVDTLIDGLQRALLRLPALTVVCTGGGLAGFHTTGFDRFQTWAQTQASRVTVHGWVPHGQLTEILASAHVGISLDRHGAEPELGSRTRLLFFVHQGLEVISTVRCQLAKDMRDHDELHMVPSGDSEALADQLCTLSARDMDGDRVARAQARLARDYDRMIGAAPLLEWIASPRRATLAELPEALLAAENTRLKDELAQVYGTTTWRALAKLHGLTRRT